MISIPLQITATMPDGILGTDPPFALAKWVTDKRAYKLYSLLPGISSNLDFPQMKTAEAYWIKTATTKAISPTGTLMDPTSNATVNISSGWNMIGNPFTSEVQWSALKVRYTVNGVSSDYSLATAAANGWVREYGWTYEPSIGNYKLVDATRSGADRTMRPWRGYWFKSNVSCQLVIPGPSSRSVSGTRAVTAADQTTSGVVLPKWQVQLIAKKDNLKDEFNYLGVSRGKDEVIESPSFFGNYVDLYFTDPKGDMCASDLRSNMAFGEAWQFNVTTDKAGTVELTWDGIESVPSGSKLVLTDDETGKSVVIAADGSYEFAFSDDSLTRSFHVTLQKR
jgi:hypothetical protein